MKVIDLLNKMANDEDYRPTVVFTRVTFTYNTIVGDYENDRDSDYGIFANYVIAKILNDEVEVIEENKEIEELDDMESINARPEVNAIKINELVRAVNKLNKEREEK